MADRYLEFVNSSLGRQIVNTLSLPAPVRLERWQDQAQPFLKGKVLVGGSKGGKALKEAATAIAKGQTDIVYPAGVASLSESAGLASSHKASAADLTKEDKLPSFKALVFDASGISDVAQLRSLYDFFKPGIRKLQRNGRVLVIGTDPAKCRSPGKAAAQKGLEGFVRSIGKEVGRKGATAQLIWVEPNAYGLLESSLQFFLSPKSAYVSGQAARIRKTEKAPAPVDPERPLAGKVALVTGASRGIGEAIAQILARDGATVVALDVPGALEALQNVAQGVGGRALGLDITDAQAPARIAEFLEAEFGAVDLVVHNAGVTRDKTLGKMPPHFWDLTLAVNLAAERINDLLLERKLVRANGRIVCVSSISGIAGNFGQTNYALSKCGVIGYVEALARQLRDGITVNAVAPGFIETQMTAAMPLTMREAGRRMNSLSQGGLPVDVAETIAWFCHPQSGGITGNVIRVCGQSLVGK